MGLFSDLLGKAGDVKLGDLAKALDKAASDIGIRHTAPILPNIIEPAPLYLETLFIKKGTGFNGFAFA